MKRFLLLAAVLLVVGSAAFVFLRSPGGESSSEPVAFEVFFTADTNGRIEPCGCFTGQLGGLTRVSSFLPAPKGARLLYEIGDAISGAADYQVIHYDYLLDAYGTIGFTAVNLGHREAGLSASELRDAASESPVPLISANLLDAATREPVVKPWVLSEIPVPEAAGDSPRTLRVATIGVVDPGPVQDAEGDGVVLVRMEEGIRNHLEEMKSEADLLVCLAFADQNRLKELANEFFEFDLILGGDVGQPSSTATLVNRTWIHATTNEARALGEVRGFYDPSTREVREVSGKVSLMIEEIPQDPEVKKFSSQYREDIRDIELAVDTPGGDTSGRVPGVAPPASYVGSAACAGCHPKAFEVWSETGHAHAFDSLLLTRSDADPSCVQCHTVGFAEPTGYQRSFEGTRLAHVGCENCHGPGSEHVALRSTASPGQEVALKMRPVGAGQCIQCHHGEFSRPFDWDQFWPLIKHGKESEN